MGATSILASLSPDDRARLTAPSDRAGLWHLAGHLGIIVGLGAVVLSGVAGWWLALWPLGIALAFLFTLQHECTHKTPFATGWLNEVAGHVAGVILVQPFLWFRAFHMAHHRHTNDPRHDPELAGDGSRPRTWPQFLWYLSTLGYWRDKLLLLWSNATGPKPSPYISPRAAPRIRAEARALIAVYAAAILAMLTVAPWLFWVWLVPLSLGFPVLRLYLLAEHDRCPEVADMLRNSRTTLTNPFTRFLAWNMPYHAEHHACPTVPFHRLPEVHGLARDEIEVLTQGYRTFVRETAEGLR